MFIDGYKADLRACQKDNDLPGMTKVLMAFCESASRKLLPKNKTTEELVVAFLEGAVLDKELLCDYFGMSDHKARYFALSMVSQVLVTFSRTWLSALKISLSSLS